MPDALVIGAGFWGSAIAARLRSEGLDVALVDSAEPGSGSRAAAGLVRWEWLKSATLPSWWNTRHEEASRGWMIELGGAETPETFSSYLKPILRERPGLWLAPPAGGLVPPDAYAKAQSLTQYPDGWRVKFDSSEVSVRRVIIAAGVWTDQLLRRSGRPLLGVFPLAGSAMMVKGELSQPVRTHMLRPYHSLTARRWLDRVRIGDTLQEGLSDETAWDRFTEEVAQVFPKLYLRPWSRQTGLRPALKGPAMVGTLGPGLQVAVGARRIGLSMAGGVALRIWEEMA